MHVFCLRIYLNNVISQYGMKVTGLQWCHRANSSLIVPSRRTDSLRSVLGLLKDHVYQSFRFHLHPEIWRDFPVSPHLPVVIHASNVADELHLDGHCLRISPYLFNIHSTLHTLFTLYHLQQHKPFQVSSAKSAMRLKPTPKAFWLVPDTFFDKCCCRSTSPTVRNLTAAD